MNVRPLETSVRDLAPATLVYVIRDGWALAYRAEMLDDRANELYVTDKLLEALPALHINHAPAGWVDQLSDEYAIKLDLHALERDAWRCWVRTESEAEFRTHYGLPVDKVQHPR